MNVKYALTAGAMVVALAACGSSAATTGNAAVAPAPPANAATTPAAPAAGAPAKAAAKVNANTASLAELQAAFQAAGISNPARWAKEVDEYRPYPTDDPNFAKLRKELVKYNPGEATVNQIVATLSL